MIRTATFSLLVACVATTRGADDLGPSERAIVGVAPPYVPSALSFDDLRKSKRARREAAWAIVAQAVSPVPVGKGTLPLFDTWYQKDDLKRIFHRVYGQLGVEGRKAKAPPALDGVFEWNASFQLGVEERLNALKDEADVAGLAAAEAISYSPGFTRHFLNNYANVLRCVSPIEKGNSDTPLDRVRPDDAFSCFDSEFPKDAVFVKASWQAEIAGPIALFDRQASLASGEWTPSGATAKPTPDEIYTARLGDGTLMRMNAMHIVTKELADWVWITLWWSDTPDEDFGADRPPLPPPWNHYKMNVVVDYDEGDTDPRGGYEGSLGDALASVHAATTWSSNPYIEHGPNNAQSNCIGCHQHAGAPMDANATLQTDDFGRKRSRQNRPADYVWSFDKKTRIARIVQAEVDVQDARDEQAGNATP